MASLDSANGPFATTRPLFPLTTLPSRSSGCPAFNLPSWDSRSYQPFHSLMTFWISSGDRPRCQSVPRNSSRYPLFVSTFILFLSFCWLIVPHVQCYDEPASRFRTFILFCASAHFPKQTRQCLLTFFSSICSCFDFLLIRYIFLLSII